MGAPPAAGRSIGRHTLALSVSPLRGASALNSIVIAGGGLAGAAAACRLAREGRPVMVLEREKAPAHKVCGEFLSGGARRELASLGIDVEQLGAAPIRALRLVHRSRVAECTLPFAAAGLSRRVLDDAMLQRAAALGADVRRGVRIRSIEGRDVLTDAGALEARLLLLATGKHDVRGSPREVGSEPEPLIGFKLHLRLRPDQQAALAGHVEVILFAGGYAGLQLIEGGVANLCLLVDRHRYEREGLDWMALLGSLEKEEPHLAWRLEGAVSDWVRPLSIFRVPYGFVHDGPDHTGIYRLGDQAAVIPSFCGDGMSIALHSARLAADAVLAGRGEAAYHDKMRRDAGPPVRFAVALYRLGRSAAIRQAVVAAGRTWPALLRAAARRTRVAI